jgi:hypothetical protein
MVNGQSCKTNDMLLLELNTAPILLLNFRLSSSTLFVQYTEVLEYSYKYSAACCPLGTPLSLPRYLCKYSSPPCLRTWYSSRIPGTVPPFSHTVQQRYVYKYKWRYTREGRVHHHRQHTTSILMSILPVQVPGGVNASCRENTGAL